MGHPTRLQPSGFSCRLSNTGPSRQPPFLSGVLHVVFFGTPPKVTRVRARRIVASVACDMLVRWPWSAINLQGQMRCHPLLRMKGKHTIADAVLGARPAPALIIAVNHPEPRKPLIGSLRTQCRQALLLHLADGNRMRPSAFLTDCSFCARVKRSITERAVHAEILPITGAPQCLRKSYASSIVRHTAAS